jgi:hypothetical protein
MSLGYWRSEILGFVSCISPICKPTIRHQPEYEPWPAGSGNTQARPPDENGGTMAAVVLLDGSGVQAAVNVEASRVRRSIKPTPKKPRSIIAQTAGSGAAEIEYVPLNDVFTS